MLKDVLKKNKRKNLFNNSKYFYENFFFRFCLQNGKNLFSWKSLSKVFEAKYRNRIGLKAFRIEQTFEPTNKFLIKAEFATRRNQASKNKLFFIIASSIILQKPFTFDWTSLGRQKNVNQHFHLKSKIYWKTFY